MSCDITLSETELKIIKAQQIRRCENRLKFLKMRSDPCKHSRESGYVFDPAVQRYLSMKATQLERFQCSPSSAIFGVVVVIIPMVVYGYLLNDHRVKREKQIRCGELRYKDRLFKLC